MRRFFVPILGLLAGWAVASPALAQGQSLAPAGETPILFTSDRLSHDRDLGVVTASGNVEISQADRILLADTVSYNERENVMTASGNVNLVEPTGDVLFADYMELSGDFKDGLIRGLRIRLADNARIAAAGGRRSDGNRTEMANAVYSACDSCASKPEEPPLWQVKAKRIVHDQSEKSIEYRDAWMEFAGVPVAYTPYFSHPDPSVRRKTGFLTPSAGASSYLGPFVTTPFFWNIAPEQDLTVTPTLTVDERAVLAGEYRRLGQKSLTNAKLSGTVDSNDEFRGHIDSSLKYHVNDTWRWGGTIQRSTDDTYMRRYGFPSNKTLTSNAFAEAFRGRDYAAANAFAFQGLQATDRPGETPFVLPFMEYSHIGLPNAYGARTSLNANALALTRNDGVDTRRFSTEGGVHIPYIGPYGNLFSLDATLRGDMYHVSSLDVPNDPGNEDSGAKGRLFPQLGLGWKLPLARQHGNISETFTPMATVYTAPKGGNYWQIPNEDSLEPEFDELNLFSPSRFPGIDRVDGGTRVSYGGQWGVYGPSGAGTDIFLGQSYRFTGDDTFAPGSGLDDQLSDYVGRVRFTPAQYVRMTYRTRLDKEDLAPRRSEVQLDAGPSALRGSLNYVFFDNGSSAQFGAREEIAGGVLAKIARNWKGGFTARHDIEESELRSVAMQLTYDCECFTFDTVLRRDFYRDRDLEPSDAILFRLTFKTLGDVHGGASLSGL